MSGIQIRIPISTETFTRAAEAVVGGTTGAAVAATVPVTLALSALASGAGAINCGVQLALKAPSEDFEFRDATQSIGRMGSYVAGAIGAGVGACVTAVLTPLTVPAGALLGACYLRNEDVFPDGLNFGFFGIGGSRGKSVNRSKAACVQAYTPAAVQCAPAKASYAVPAKVSPAAVYPAQAPAKVSYPAQVIAPAKAVYAAQAPAKAGTYTAPVVVPADMYQVPPAKATYPAQVAPGISPTYPARAPSSAVPEPEVQI